MRHILRSILRHLSLVLAAGFVMLVAGCSGDSTAPDPETPETPLSRITAGPDGGVWESEGFQLHIPAEQLPENTNLSLYAEDERTSQPEAEVAAVYRIEGLPVGLGLDFPVRLEHAAASGDSLVAMVGQMAYIPSLDRAAMRWQMVACSDSSGWALFDLPVAGPAAGVKDEPPALLVTVVSGVATAPSAGGRFKIHWRPDQINADDAARLAQQLENALDLYDLLGYQQQGFTDWPVTVQVEPMTASGYWKPDPRRLGGILAIGVDTVGDVVETPMTVGHELMHLCQYFYDPRSVYERGTVGPVHVWFNEATAVHMEIYFAPDEDYPTVSRLGHELELLSGLVSPRTGLSLADHGYGVSSLVRYLAREEAMADNFILATYEAIAGGAHAAAALQAATATDITARWQDILEQLVRGEIYSDVTWPVLDAHPRDDLLTVAGPADTTATLVRDMADLSGLLASVTLNRSAWTAQHRLVFWTEQADCGVTVLGITAAGGRDLVGRGTGRVVLSDPANLQSLYERLLVLVADPRLEGPDYAGTRQVVLQARVREAEAPPAYSRLSFQLKCDVTYDDGASRLDNVVNILGADGNFSDGLFTASWDSTIDGTVHFLGQITVAFDAGLTEITSYNARTGIWYTDGTGAEYLAVGGGVQVTTMSSLSLRAEVEGVATCAAVPSLTGTEVSFNGERHISGRDCRDSSYLRFILWKP